MDKVIKLQGVKMEDWENGGTGHIQMLPMMALFERK